MKAWQILVIFGTGFAAGIFNTTAAGGTILTLPVLIFLGLPTAVANGTNRLAVLVQSISAVSVFQRSGKIDVKLAFRLSIPALAGCILGAEIAVDLSDAFFRRFLALMMLFLLGVILWNPLGENKTDAAAMSGTKRWVLLVVFFFIGIYGGLIMAGIGFFIIAAFFFIAGFDLVRSNAQKVFVIGIFNVAGLLVFFMHGKIEWLVGLILACGQGIGAWIGSVLAIQKGERWIRIFLSISIILMALKLAGILPFFPQ